jgi:DUF4097 and DUF4098 domain-containing protein YvlB
MKWVTIIIVVWLSTFSAGAQQVIERHIDFSEKESVKLNLQIADSINIRTWEKNEVYIRASVNINENKDNAAYVTSFDDSGSSVIVDAKFRDNYFKGKTNCCNKSEIYWQVIIPERKAISVESINADVTIVGQTGEMKVKTISGFIDLSASAGRDADVDFSTVSGTIYSDQNLISQKSSTGLPVKITGKLNNGGSAMKLETISGDIYFRKSDIN